ncbi:hypothetical protein FACS1894208_00240 [Clostridia bacterium]|nr:hypothetical protein FACS1894208_00240 [Clostridia bacterium]
MTGPTHRAFSVTFALCGSVALTHFGMSEVNPLVAAPVLLMAARYGALLPDVDHHWDSVSDKTFPNRVINGFINITGGTHRSWQTHSWDIYLLFLAIALFFPREVLDPLGTPTVSVLYMLVYGVLLGWGSHLFSDMLTPQGVRLVCWRKFKLRLVPKIHMFATNSAWEDICFKVMKFVNVFVGIAYLGWCTYTVGLIDKIRPLLQMFNLNI